MEIILSLSARLSHGWVWRGSAVHMLLWLEPLFICWGKCWKHLPCKLAIWRLENSIPSRWFKHLGKVWLEHKNWEVFCLLMSITFRDHYRFMWPSASWMAQWDNTSISDFSASFIHSSALIWAIVGLEWHFCCYNLDFFHC